MSSFYDTWADRFDWSTSFTADIPFYVGLARDADGPLVELAVGNARVAIPVAQATGRRVIGIDSSPAMLAQARVRAVEEGVELDLREGDIRELEIEEPAALIYCPGRSLLHLPTWADRRSRRTRSTGHQESSAVRCSCRDDRRSCGRRGRPRAQRKYAPNMKL